MKDTYVTEVNFVAGMCEEYGVRRFLFDISDFQNSFGDGRLMGQVTRPGETNSYPVELSLAGNYGVWVPQAYDTDVPGAGRLMLRWYTEEGLAISREYVFRILGRKSSEGEVPQKELRWYQELLEAGQRTENYAEAARQSALEAKRVLEQLGQSSGGAGEIPTEPFVDITLSEAVARVDVTTDKDGNPFRKTDVWIYVQHCPIDTTETGYVNCRISLTDTIYASGRGDISATNRGLHTKKLYSLIHYKQYCGCMLPIDYYTSVNVSSQSTTLARKVTNYDAHILLVDDTTGEFKSLPKVMDHFYILGNSKPILGAGSRIMAWGR